MQSKDAVYLPTIRVLSVCVTLLVTTVSPTETAEPIEVRICGVDLGEPCIRWGSDPHEKGHFGKGNIWVCIDMPAVDILNLVHKK